MGASTSQMLFRTDALLEASGAPRVGLQHQGNSGGVHVADGRALGQTVSVEIGGRYTPETRYGGVGGGLVDCVVAVTASASRGVSTISSISSSMISSILAEAGLSTSRTCSRYGRGTACTPPYLVLPYHSYLVIGEIVDAGLSQSVEIGLKCFDELQLVVFDEFSVIGGELRHFFVVGGHGVDSSKAGNGETD